MADAIKVYEGTMGATESTVVTVGANKALIITEIILTNRHASVATTALVKAGTGTVIVPTKSIAAGDGYVLSGLHTVVLAGKTIKVTAGAADSIDYYISGVEVDV